MGGGLHLIVIILLVLLFPCPHLVSRYSGNAEYFGGVVSFSSTQFEAINGFPNNFWGWGGEDDEMALRVRGVGYSPAAPPADCGGSFEDLEHMSLDDKLQVRCGTPTRTGCYCYCYCD